MIVKEVLSGWKYSEVGGQLSGEAVVPGTIHTDLLLGNKIDDPFFRINEKELQWIDKKDWEYATTFYLANEELIHSNLILCFEGLDTYADVFLNGQLVLHADNMFRHWEVDIKPLACVGENDLKIYFHSPVKKGLEFLSASPYPLPAFNDQSENGGIGDSKISVFTRKAGYHYGWDWGPRFVTSGIWRPVILKAWSCLRINDLFIHQLKTNEEKAQLAAEISIQADDCIQVDLLLTDQQSEKIWIDRKLDLVKGNNKISISFEIDRPELWWSNGLGEAHLYHFEAQLLTANELLCSKKISTGLRSLKLIREKDEVGESFYFELNGVPVFAKGANYIPQDSFLPRVTDTDYKQVISDAVSANMNMLRVWGGGIYENDIFYDLCDRNGILVWQDFMFACSMYPGDMNFLENVRQEAVDNVTRLRNHPCIALWCGNNEINVAWNYYSQGGWGWKEKYTKEQGAEIQKAYLDVFHDILPRVVAELTDGDDYWPSSPQAGFHPREHANYQSPSGDMHYWGVWHGLHAFEEFENYKSRFMSEYGFQSFPELNTVKQYALPEDFDIESEVMASHQRSGIGNLRIKEYMEQDYPVPTNFEHFLYLSQVLQARGVKAGIESHRRAMPYCMGTLYWQINDCWPVASWSSIDYFHRKKALHYAVTKAFTPVLVCGAVQGDRMQVFGISDRLSSVNAELTIVIMDFYGSITNEFSLQVCLDARACSLLYSVDLRNLISSGAENRLVAKLQLVSDGNCLSQNLVYFAKPKDLQLPHANLSATFVNDEKTQLSISSDTFAKDVYMSFSSQLVGFSDNFFDLLPGESRCIGITSENIPDLSALKILSLDQVF